jgi:prophage tail gpP-like protein
MLVHPTLGGIRVAWSGIEGSSIDVAQAVNTITIPITFVADVVDAARNNEFPTVAIRTSDVMAAILQMTSTAAPFTTAAAAVTLLATTAATYARSGR